ncbi:MAG: hypothetical protein GY705_14850, partial [Bacteroidetes bacterium]|nr:hypothetical protein [Bacteroidota bacterium]
ATSPQQLNELTVEQYKKLRKILKTFGKSVGNKNLVAFVNNPGTERLNISMGKTYADRFNHKYGESISYNDGPFLVFLTKHPDSLQVQKEDLCVAFSLKGDDFNEIVDNILYLEQLIRRDEVTNMSDVSYVLKSEFSSVVKNITKDDLLAVFQFIRDLRS